MADDVNNPNPPTPSPGTALRKTLFTAGVLLVAWLLFVQIAPRFMFGDKKPLANPFTATQEMPPPPPPVGMQAPPPPPPPPAPGEEGSRLDALEARIKVLEDLITTSPELAKNNAPAPEGAEQPGSVPAFLQESRVAGLEKKLSAQEASLQVMQEQLEENKHKTSHEFALMSAYTQLKEASTRGDSFEGALAQLQSLTADSAPIDALISQLAPYAQNGVPTPAELKKSFEQAADRALTKEEETGSLMNNLRSLVRVRKVGQQEGTTDEAIIARAEVQVNEGDINAALKEIATLSPKAADAFAEWTATAQAYAAVQQTLDTLQLAIAGGSAAEAETSE